MHDMAIPLYYYYSRPGNYTLGGTRRGSRVNNTPVGVRGRVELVQVVNELDLNVRYNNQ